MQPLPDPQPWRPQIWTPRAATGACIYQYRPGDNLRALTARKNTINTYNKQALPVAPERRRNIGHTSYFCKATPHMYGIHSLMRVCGAHAGILSAGRRHDRNVYGCRACMHAWPRSGSSRPPQDRLVGHHSSTGAGAGPAAGTAAASGASAKAAPERSPGESAATNPGASSVSSPRTRPPD